MLELLGALDGKSFAATATIAALLFVGAAYFFIALDRHRANSVTKDDGQVGLKLVLFGLILAGILLATGGVHQLLAYILGGFKGGSLPVRRAIPSIVVGGAVVFAVLKLLLPRTNADTQKQPERFLLGTLGIQYGVATLIALNGLLEGIFLEAPWGVIAASLASVAISGAVAFLAITRFGKAAGWKEPPPRPVAPPPAQYPPQQYPPQGYGPPQGGYGPQGGGGGYGPPQGGGGYGPPQGGGGGYGPPGT